MDEVWLTEENIMRFRSLLAESCDEERRTTLIDLLAKERAKLRYLLSGRATAGDKVSLSCESPMPDWGGSAEAHKT